MKNKNPFAIAYSDMKRLGQMFDSPETPTQLKTRVRIILMSILGETSVAIACKLQTTRPTVKLWRERYIEKGVEGILKDAPRSGRKLVISKEVRAAILRETNQEYFVNTKELALRHNVSPAFVQRLWAANGMATHFQRDRFRRVAI